MLLLQLLLLQRFAVFSGLCRDCVSLLARLSCSGVVLTDIGKPLALLRIDRRLYPDSVFCCLFGISLQSWSVVS